MFRRQAVEYTMETHSLRLHYKVLMGLLPDGDEPPHPYIGQQKNRTAGHAYHWMRLSINVLCTIKADGASSFLHFPHTESRHLMKE